MIRCRNCLVRLVANRMKFQVSSRVRNLSTDPEQSPKIDSGDAEQQKRQEKHDQFMRRAMILKGSFESADNKDKSTYLDMIRVFEGKDVHRRNHVEFIYAAMKNMEDYGVHKDLAVYKALIDVMPKGKFIPTNVFQAEFMHYPKQQNCITDLLEQMEDNGVMPDYEIEDMLINIFGKKGHPVRKFWRMMYWMPKFKNLSPWVVPNPPPNEALELAKLAVERMCSVDLRTKISIYQTSDVENAIDDTWIVSGQSPVQKELLSSHQKESAIFIEGPFLIWLRNRSVTYFVLRGDSPKGPQIEPDDYDDVRNIDVPIFGFTRVERKKVALMKTVHEQDEGTIYAICCTGSSTKDSLLSWIRLLEKEDNPNLANLAVLFKFKSAVDKQLVVATDQPATR